MKSLHLDTSTTLGGVCLKSNSRVVGIKTSLIQKSHSEFLHPAIHFVLTENKISFEELDFIGCGIGPGSFTGIRIAVGAAKTFGTLLQKPLVPVTTLETLAMPFVGLKHSRVLAIMNAYKNMVYYGMFDVQRSEPELIGEIGAVHVADLHERIDLSENFWLVGDGFNTYLEYLPQKVLNLAERPCEDRLSEVFDRTLIENLGKLAELKYKKGQTKDWTSLLPLYIRSSEAEEQLNGIKLKPL